MGLDRREGELTADTEGGGTVFGEQEHLQATGRVFLFLEVQQRTTTVHRNLPVGITQQRET